MALIGRLLVLAGGGARDLAFAGWFYWYGGLRLNYPFNGVSAGSKRQLRLDLVTLA